MNDNFKIHAGYIVGILVAIIIILLTKQFSGDTQLVDAVSFAATIASLILAILAIIHSLIANSDMNSNLGKLTGFTKTFESTAGIIDAATIKLHDVLKVIPEQIASVDEKMKLILINNQQNLKTPEKTSSIKAWDDESINAFLQMSSFYGKSLVYAMALSYSTKKPFKLDDLYSSSNEYIYGYLVAARSFFIVDLTESNGIISIVSLNQYLSLEKLKPIIIESCDNTKNDESTRQFRTDVKKKIESYFSS